MSYSRKWERIDEGTERMKVPGGWLVRSFTLNLTEAICFFPDPKAEWIFDNEVKS
jgi:hypothetical protein